MKPIVEVVPFADLSVGQLYSALQLRGAVFVVEQDCVYQDLDGLDHLAEHVFVWCGGDLAAYTRLLPPAVVHAEGCAIGRVVAAAEYRGRGLGRLAFGESVGECRRRWPGTNVLLHAQTYLLAFYEDFGFEVEGEPFLEDGIPHRLMRLPRGRGDENAAGA